MRTEGHFPTVSPKKGLHPVPARLAPLVTKIAGISVCKFVLSGRVELGLGVRIVLGVIIQVLLSHLVLLCGTFPLLSLSS